MTEKEYQEKWRGKSWTRERVEDALAVYLPGWRIRDASWEPSNSEDDAPLTCPNGHHVDRRCHNINQGRGCKQCKAEIIREDMAEKFISSLKEKGYVPLFDAADYKNAHQKLPTLCPAGNKYLISAILFIDKGIRCACSSCTQRKRPKKWRTKDEAIAELRMLGEEVISEYVNTRTPVLSRCVKCGYEREIIPYSYFSRKASCAKCAGTYKVTTSEYREELRSKGWDLPEGVEYVNKDTPILHMCPYGHITLKKPGNWRSGFGCEICMREDFSERYRGVNLVTGEELSPERLAELEEERKSPEYARWRNDVLERDGHACVLCDSRSDLNVHHLYSFTNFPDLRYDLDNGVTLCEVHHLNKHPGSFHAVYGQDGQTVGEQFLEYLDNFIANANGADLPRLFSLRDRVAQFVERVSREPFGDDSIADNPQQNEEYQLN